MIDLNAIKNINVKSVIRDYINDLTKSCDNSLRSWDKCRQAFLSAAQKRHPNMVPLKHYENGKNDFCDTVCFSTCHFCDNYLALNLMSFLSSWGMYRSSFLKEYDYTIHIGAVKILMDINYVDLFNSNLCYTQSARYCELVETIYNDLFTYYKGKCKRMSLGATDTLITKILLGVYGCMPAYDTYFKSGIGSFGGTKSVTVRNIGKIASELADIAGSLKQQIDVILANAKNSWDKQGIYTPMKIIDMIFWS